MEAASRLRAQPKSAGLYPGAVGGGAGPRCGRGRGRRGGRGRARGRGRGGRSSPCERTCRLRLLLFWNTLLQMLHW